MTDLDPSDLPTEMLDFLVERHLATLTIVKADNTPHVTPVGVTYEPVSYTHLTLPTNREV